MGFQRTIRGIRAIFEVQKPGKTIAIKHYLSYVRVSNVSKMTTFHRKCIWNNVYLSVYIHDSNESPTAIPMFSMSSNTTGLIQTLPCVVVSEKSKGAVCTGSLYGITYISACMRDNEIPKAINMFSMSSNTTGRI